VQHFISGLPKDYRDRIESDEPKTLKSLSERQDIVMNNLDIRKNLAKVGNQRIVQDFREKGLNPQDLRTIRRTQG
jgi:hypothetical protein